jgi:GMP synthase (glutamine-hydrolysing)
LTARLKAEIWVKAYIRRCRVHDVMATLVRRGDADAGAVLIKLNMLENGAAVLSQTRDAEGRPVWLRATGPAPVEERKADDYIARQLAFDSDLWVIEVEDREGRHCLDDEVA